MPGIVDDFSNQVNVVSLTRVGTTVTIETEGAHGLAVGNLTNITGALVPINCTITRNGILGTLTTDADHDITENAGFDVQTEGATEQEFNGTFTLQSVTNRRTINFIMDDSGPTVATGSPLLLNGSSPLKQYNGLVGVSTVPTLTSFTYEVEDDTLYTPASGDIVVKTLPRISGGVSLERLVSAYTKQKTNDAWLFVVLGDGVADKSRKIDTDATDNIQRGHEFNQRIIQVVQVYVFLPTVGEIGGEQARDRCEELLSPICRSILTAKFQSLVSGGNNPLMITGHGAEIYNGAFYVHQYAFESTLQMGESDIYQPTDDVAFRDIHLTTRFDVGTGELETNIDLDEEQL